MTEPTAPPRRTWGERHPVLGMVLATLLTLLVFDLMLGTYTVGNLVAVPDQDYHHGLAPNVETEHQWGPLTYWLTTNSLGFKDSRAREVPLTTDRWRVVFIGDSFTEGVGYPFEQTFVGRVASRLDDTKVEVLNAAVSSYSPRLMKLKVRKLVEQVGLRFQELVVFLDVSDPQDEIIYESWVPGNAAPWSQDAVRWMARHSLSFRRLVPMPATGTLHRRGTASDGSVVEWKTLDEFERERAMWTSRPDLIDRWARRGLELGARHMDELLALCRAHNIRVSMAVYPWPQQVVKGEVEPLQRRFWEEFAAARGVPLVEYFSTVAVEGWERARRYYVDGDLHLNDVGHELFADRWLQARCQDAPAGDRLCAARRAP
ncbi:MAG: SGNH/GDSL hydrolase family protein [Myxococcota bacterium]